jgi:uncharacterized membrane protein
VAKLVGLRPSRASKTILRLAGLREIGHGAGILSNPRPKEWVGTRIGGDVMDIALLGAAMLHSEHKERTVLATAAVLGVSALDVLAFQELSESRALPEADLTERAGSTARRSLTIGAPPEQVYSFWRDFENAPRFMKHIESVVELDNGRTRWHALGPKGVSASWEAELQDDRPNERIAWKAVEPADFFNEGVVLFRPARDGGTVVTVEMRYAPPGGRIGAAMLRLLHKEPGQTVADDLRRLKALLETGDVVESDATLGPSTPHPAQPVGTVGESPGGSIHRLAAGIANQSAAGREEAL